MTRPTAFRDDAGDMIDINNLKALKNTGRWVIRRKMQVVLAVRSGVMTVEEAKEWLDISPEEIAEWTMLYNRRGRAGLKSTQRQR